MHESIIGMPWFLLGTVMGFAMGYLFSISRESEASDAAAAAAPKSEDS